jgi:hypothetical protein
MPLIHVQDADPRTLAIFLLSSLLWFANQRHSGITADCRTVLDPPGEQPYCSGSSREPNAGLLVIVLLAANE